MSSVCNTCLGTQFEEDEQGFFVCQLCGTVSQDFILQSHEDDYETPGQAQRLEQAKFRFKHLQGSSKRLASTQDRPSKASKASDVAHVLEAFQCSLLILTKAVIKHGKIDIVCAVSSESQSLGVATTNLKQSETKPIHRGPMSMDTSHSDSSDESIFGIRSSFHPITTNKLNLSKTAVSSDKKTMKAENIFVSAIESIWFKYIDKLIENNAQILDFFEYSIDKSENKDETFRNVKANDSNINLIEMYPSRSLLLSIIHYICAYYRLNISSVMLCRWCEQGLLPYNTLWSRLPSKIKGKLSKSYHFLFDAALSTISVTPRKLLEQTIRLIKFCGLKQMTPLNSPLIAKTFITALGFPKEIWTNYVSISKILDTCDALQGFEAYGEYHIENILSIIFIAMKMSNHWMLWSLISNPLDNPIQWINPTPSGSIPNQMKKPGHIGDPSAILSDYMRFPTTINELDSIPRLLLLPFLRQFVKSIPAMNLRKNELIWNQGIKKVLLSLTDDELFSYSDHNLIMDAISEQRAYKSFDLDKLLNPTRSEAGDNDKSSSLSSNSTNKQDNRKISIQGTYNSVFGNGLNHLGKERYHWDIQGNPCILWNNYIYFHPLTIQENREYLYKLHGLTTDGPQRSNLSESIASLAADDIHRIQTMHYLSYYDYTADKYGRTHPVYTIHLERCAKYIFTSPMVLHRNVMEKFDGEILNAIKGLKPRQSPHKISTKSSSISNKALFERIISMQRRRDPIHRQDTSAIQIKTFLTKKLRRRYQTQLKHEDCIQKVELNKTSSVEESSNQELNDISPDTDDGMKKRQKKRKLMIVNQYEEEWNIKRAISHQTLRYIEDLGCKEEYLSIFEGKTGSDSSMDPNGPASDTQTGSLGQSYSQQASIHTVDSMGSMDEDGRTKVDNSHNRSVSYNKTKPLKIKPFMNELHPMTTISNSRRRQGQRNHLGHDNAIKTDQVLNNALDIDQDHSNTVHDFGDDDDDPIDDSEMPRHEENRIDKDNIYSDEDMDDFIDSFIKTNTYQQTNQRPNSGLIDTSTGRSTNKNQKKGKNASDHSKQSPTIDSNENDGSNTSLSSSIDTSDDSDLDSNDSSSATGQSLSDDSDMEQSMSSSEEIATKSEELRLNRSGRSITSSISRHSSAVANASQNIDSQSSFSQFITQNATQLSVDSMKRPEHETMVNYHSDRDDISIASDSVPLIHIASPSSKVAAKDFSAVSSSSHKLKNLLAKKQQESLLQNQKQERKRRSMKDPKVAENDK